MCRRYRLELHLVFDETAQMDNIMRAIDAAQIVWGFHTNTINKIVDGEKLRYTLYGEDHLIGNETEEALVRYVRNALWEAAGCFVEITLRATCLDAAPSNTYQFGREAYDEYAASLHTEKEVQHEL